MPTIHKIVPCLWFDDEAEEAARFYVSVFEGSRIDRITRYGEDGEAEHARPPGSVLTVAFELGGQPFTALNGGRAVEFSDAMSLQVMCDTQDEIDCYWARLSAGGDAKAQRGGWLKDRYGLSWQLVPARLTEWIADPDPVKASRTVRAIFQMKKLDIAALERAHAGEHFSASPVM